MLFDKIIIIIIILLFLVCIVALYYQINFNKTKEKFEDDIFNIITTEDFLYDKDKVDNATMKPFNMVLHKLNEKKIYINNFTCSKNGSLMILLSNQDNIIYISYNNGEKWYFKNLPNNNEWGKIYLLELNINKYLLILFGVNRNIYISTNLGEQWKLISVYKGNSVTNSDKNDYIYISTNKGILYINNYTITLETDGCNNECLNDYENYNGPYKFINIKKAFVIDKNITNITCNKKGNIILFSIDNKKLYSGKIKNDKWEFFELNDIEYCDDIVLLENSLLTNESYFLVNNTQKIYVYKYNSNEKDLLEEKKELEILDYERYLCEEECRYDIKINKVLKYIIATNIGYILLINNRYLVYYDTIKMSNDKFYIRESDIYIKDIIVNKNATKAIIIDSNGVVYVNDSFKEYFTDKSEFKKIEYNIGNTY
jgi:hypothetical protein